MAKPLPIAPSGAGPAYPPALLPLPAGRAAFRPSRSASPGAAALAVDDRAMHVVVTDVRSRRLAHRLLRLLITLLLALILFPSGVLA